MITPFADKHPQVAQDAFVAQTAVVLGDVVLGQQASVWYGAVVRGDVYYVRIGDQTNIQDNTVIHVTTDTHATVIGKRVTVGHGAILHGCRIEDRALIGMGAIVLDQAVIASESIVAAGALVPPRKSYPPRSLIMGNPARRVREITSEEMAQIDISADRYVELGGRHATQGH